MTYNKFHKFQVYTLMSCYEIVPQIKRLNIFSALCYLSLLFFPTSCPSAGSLRSAVTIDIYVNAVLQYVPFCLFFTQCNYFEIHLCQCLNKERCYSNWEWRQAGDLEVIFIFSQSAKTSGSILSRRNSKSKGKHSHSCVCVCVCVCVHVLGMKEKVVHQGGHSAR